jgi:hypothetical protein
MRDKYLFIIFFGVTAFCGDIACFVAKTERLHYYFYFGHTNLVIDSFTEDFRKRNLYAAPSLSATDLHTLSNWVSQPMTSVTNRNDISHFPLSRTLFDNSGRPSVEFLFDERSKGLEAWLKNLRTHNCSRKNRITKIPTWLSLNPGAAKSLEIVAEAVATK